MVKQKGFPLITTKGDYTCDNCGVQNIHKDYIHPLNKKHYCGGCYLAIKKSNKGASD